MRCNELLHWIPAEKGGGDVSMLQLSACEEEGRMGGLVWWGYAECAWRVWLWPKWEMRLTSVEKCAV